MAFSAAALEANLAPLLASLTSVSTQASRLVVALSGGADSVALLLALSQSRYADRVRAVHINHQLQAEAQAWAGFCEQLCQRVGIAYVCLAVELKATSSKQKGLEASAREARYEALFRAMRDDDVLLVAHHADDQLETLLFRIERGAGLRGLVGIRSNVELTFAGLKRRVVRPLLTQSKAALIEFLEQQQQDWVEDPSNREAQYRRSYYRQHIMPLLPQQLLQDLQRTQSLAETCSQELRRIYERWIAERKQVEGLALRLLKADFDQPQFTQAALSNWLSLNAVSLPSKRMQETYRQLEQARGAGQSPFFTGDGYRLFVRGRKLTVILASADQPLL